ncbi:hypothetical protein VTO73DRAFT_7024 [Trametes versicolor]
MDDEKAYEKHNEKGIPERRRGDRKEEGGWGKFVADREGKNRIHALDLVEEYSSSSFRLEGGASVGRIVFIRRNLQHKRTR